jgi:hypothetical protein
VTLIGGLFLAFPCALQKRVVAVDLVFHDKQLIPVSPQIRPTVVVRRYDICLFVSLAIARPSSTIATPRPKRSGVPTSC